MPKKKKSENSSVVDITRSYSRKLNMAAHGGQQYETIDLFSSRTAKDVPAEEQEEVSAALYQACVDEVEAQVKALDSEVEDEEEAPKKSKKKAKKVVEEEDDEDDEEDDEDDDTIDVGGFKMNKSEFRDISPYVNDLTISKTSADLAKAVKRIKEEASTFTEDQKKYLSMYYKKRAAAIEEEEDDE